MTLNDNLERLTNIFQTAHMHNFTLGYYKRLLLGIKRGSYVSNYQITKKKLL